MERKIILYSDISPDGFIAQKDGSLDWLTTDGDFGYEQFYDSIDTTVMGNTTYGPELSFGEFLNDHSITSF